MNQLSRIFETPLSKKEVITLATQEATSLTESADTNLLPLVVNVKRAKDYLETFEKSIKQGVLSEAQKHGTSSFKAHGATFSVKENGTRYDFTVCQDDTYNELTHQLEELKEQIKSREAFLKSLKGSMTVVCEITGDINTVYPPVKTSETGVSIAY